MTGGGQPFDLADVGYIKRVVVGNCDPEHMLGEEELARQQALLNRCLSGIPRGRIVGKEMNFYILNIGQHQVVVQYVCYHVGFVRKPLWL